MTKEEYRTLINYLNITHPDDIRLTHDDVEGIVSAIEEVLNIYG